MSRKEFAFTNEAKEYIHQRDQGQCSFPGYACPRPVENPIVNHITGCFEARLDDKTPESITDPEMNGGELCNLHIVFHDVQERDQVANLIYEAKMVSHFESRGRHYTRIQRRRNKR